jgi:hypothetical protein
VQRFRAAGVTVALVLGGFLTEPAGFQQQAEAQGYRPKYPIAQAFVEMVDPVADVAYNLDAQDGNIGLRTQSWEWTQRKPARFANNATAQYCIDAYSKKTGQELDVYEHDAQLNQLLSACAALEVARQAIVNAGPNLTQETFLRGLYQIRNMETSECPTSSFGPGKYSGQDSFAMAQFKKARWQPENNLWHTVTPWRPWFVT